MDFFFENLGLLFFLFFLFLQFVGSLFGQRRRGKRPPVQDGDEVGPDPATEERPTTFEDALRQIQDALREANRSQQETEVVVSEPPPTSTMERATLDTEDEANTPAFRHFEDFEQRGEDSGAHAGYAAEEASRESEPGDGSAFERLSLPSRGTRAATESIAESPLQTSTTSVSFTAQPGRSATDALARLRAKLRSPEAVQDAYRLHVVLGEPRARRRHRSER